MIYFVHKSEEGFQAEQGRDGMSAASSGRIQTSGLPLVAFGRGGGNLWHLYALGW